MQRAIIATMAVGLGLMGTTAMAQDNLAYIGTSLFGELEAGGKGAGKDASGDFSAEMNLATGRFCYMLEVVGLDVFSAAHLHEGAKGKDGPPVIELQLMGDDGEDICVDVDPALLKKIAKRKSNYYVNVHTVEFPAGAIRGQLDE
ncbi:CHRD domain-containing protein [Altererythrobacter sp.]|uniref:CHRD domain-containing protein n=1 Tax=Altererythrobacter sp. TaxID=1872480 RepID=UPI003CFC940F